MTEAPPPLTVEETGLSAPYAAAAWAAAEAKGQGEEFAAELEAFAGPAASGAPGFAAFATIGTIGAAERLKALTALKGNASDLLFNTLAVLNQHGRLGLYRGVAAEVRRLANAAKGQRRVTAVSATALPADQQDALRNILASALGAEPILEFAVEPALVGGLQVRIGETLYDYSVRANLARLRTDLLARSANEIQSGRDRVDSP